MSKPAVAFFGFNRPDCTEQVFSAIRKFQPETLLLVADGPRKAAESDAFLCQKVREIITRVDWRCEVKQNFSEYNLGCKQRMASGLDWVFSEVEEAIILEDDCVPCPDFFKFCGELLPYYRNEPHIGLISGDNFQDGRTRGSDSYYFSRYLHIWGWASWRRAWRSYDISIKSWPEAKANGWLRTLGFDTRELEYWTNIFDQVYRGEINTWDYQWVYSCWQRGALGIVPNVNLITNIGASPDATHTKGAKGSLEIKTGTISDIQHPGAIERNLAADEYTFNTHYDARTAAPQPSGVQSARKFLGRIKKKFLG